MPALRSVRRSRRLLNKPPRDAVFEDPDEFDLHDRQAESPRERASPAPAVRSTRKTPPSPGPFLPPFSPNPFSCPELDFIRRSSHSRKRDADHIPRPPNAFMLFRSELWAKEKIKSTVERDHRMISRMAGAAWNALPESERVPYRRLAELAKQRHAEAYPDYKYSPVFKKERLPRRRGGKGANRDFSRCDVVARLLGEGCEGDELEERIKDYDRKKVLYVIPPRRIRTRATKAQRRGVQRQVSPDTRTPSPVSSNEDDLIKMEPSTPEIPSLPDPGMRESELLEATHPPCFLPPLPPNLTVDDEKHFDRHFSVERGTPVPTITMKQWPDVPPAILNFSRDAHGQGYVRPSSQDLMLPVSVCTLENDGAFGEAVDDAFSISPMFNPDRSSALLDPEPASFDTHSPPGDPKTDDEVDYDFWLAAEH